MKIIGDIDDRSFDFSLEPLFQAMLNGQVISSITFMTGQINKDNPSKDKTITDVKALEYYPGMSQQFNKESSSWTKHDYVESEAGNFYMSWVRSYTL